MSVIKLAINRQTQAFVNYLNCVTVLPPLFQSNTQQFQIYIVDPVDQFGGYSVVDMANSGLRMAIGDTPTGASGGPTPLTLQDTWPWNAAGKYFSASLALNVGAVDAFIGSLASKQAYIEINETLSANRTTLFQGTVTLKAVVDELTAVVPTPTDQYLTKPEIIGGFVRKIGINGDRIVLPSANGVYALELGCNDDGTMAANVITL